MKKFAIAILKTDQAMVINSYKAVNFNFNYNSNNCMAVHKNGN